MSSQEIDHKSPLPHDIEKHGSASSIEAIPQEGSTEILAGPSIWQKLQGFGVETRGAKPVEIEARTDTRFFNVFTVFSTSMLSLLPIGTGIIPTFIYGLSLRDSFLLIFFFTFLFTAAPAWILTFAPQTGMRQMVQSRYSYGYWPNIIVCLLTMVTVGGFCVTASSIGGQCLAQVSGGKISTEVGIVIIMIPASFLAFSGYKILHIYQRWGWIPTFVVLCITFGYGGKGLKNQATPPPPEAPTVINIIALIAGYLISWGNVVGDYCVYMPANTPKWRLFTYCLMGISLPLAALLTAGAAIGGAIVDNPTWLAAYKLHSTGGVLGVMLEDAGSFGKFILVVVAFSVLGSCGRDMYTISVDWQILIPKANKVPRLIWVVVTAGCVVGVAIGAVRSFYAALENFLYFIAYWSSSYVAVIMLEFMLFRKNRPESYDHEIWDTPSRLPPGIAATAASLIPWALVVPSMAETWYTGPIAKITGDLGFEFAGIITIILYIPFRMLEIRWRKGVN